MVKDKSREGFTAYRISNITAKKGRAKIKNRFSCHVQVIIKKKMPTIDGRRTKRSAYSGNEQARITQSAKKIKNNMTVTSLYKL